MCQNFNFGLPESKKKYVQQTVYGNAIEKHAPYDNAIEKAGARYTTNSA